jgi:carbon monoxide dehydrogenase subunit G
MQLEHEFVVPVPVSEAWDVLLDVERIAPCMPGATVESFDGENVQGRVKVKVGPIQVTYAGSARFVEKDEAARRLTIDAKGKEARGSGTASATIRAQLLDDGGASTKVTVTTELAITGKPAQFGRGVMVEVGNKLLGRFADCLAREIVGGDAASEGPAASGESNAPTDAAANPAPPAVAPPAAAQASPPPASPTPVPRPAPPRAARDEAINLLDTAGPAVLKRAAPVVAGLVLLLLIWRVTRRR